MKKVFIVLLALVSVSVLYVIWPNGPKRNLPATLQKSAGFLYSGNYDSSEVYARQVLTDARNLNNIAYANNIIGYCWFAKGNLDSSYHYYNESLHASNKSDSVDYELKIRTLMALGAIFENFQINKKAIQYYSSAVQLLEIYESKSIVRAYFNLAYNQSKINDIECVQSYYYALEYATKYKNDFYESLCLHDLGNLMLDTKNYESAIEYYNMSLVSVHTKNNKEDQAFAYQGIGEANFFMGNYDLAEKNLLKAEEIKKGLDNQKYRFSSHLFLARLNKEKGLLEKSENEYRIAIQYYPLNELNRQNIKVYKELSDVQLAQGKTQQSYETNVKHYAEVDRYLDEREKATQLAKQDQFDTTVAVTEAQYRIRDKWELLKEDLNWGLILKVGALLYILLLGFFAHHLIRAVKQSFTLPPELIHRTA